MEQNKKLILKIGAIFIGVLLFLTFFSNTIYSFNLPHVVLEYPREGAILRTATGRGIVDFVVKDAYYAEIGGIIELAVLEGEPVSAGSVLYTISAQNSLNEDMLRLRLEKARQDKAFAQTRLNDLRSGNVEQDKEVEKARLALEAAQKELSDFTLLFEAGAIPQKDLNDKQVAVDNLVLQYQQQTAKKQNALQELEKSLRDLQFQIEEHEMQLEAGSAGKITVTAERGGVVREVGNHIDSGVYISPNEAILKIGITDENYKATFALPDNVDYLNVDDVVALTIKSRNIYNAQGEIRRLFMEEGRLKAEVRFKAEGVSGGETAEIKVHHTSDLYQNLLPLSAFRSDSYGDYALYAERVNGPFGYEYYAKRVNVWENERDNYNVAVWMYLGSGDSKPPVIINSDKPISEGDRVRIVGGSDLVEIR